MPLFIVATPIGNLSDITERALTTLREADLIVAEDTRTTRKLLDRYDIQVPTKSFHQHSVDADVAAIVDELDQGRSVALVTDAGTPGVSDPGGALVAAVVAKNITSQAQNNQSIPVVPIPGPNALGTILSVADFLVEPTLFVGFLPKKKGRQTTLANLKQASGKYGIQSVVIYESPERIQRTLADLSTTFGPETHVVVGRELTKQFEEIWYGSVTAALAHFEKPKGEFTLLVQTHRDR